MPLFASYNLHLPHLHIDTSRNLSLLYVLRILRDLANQTSFFFLPIFLYTLGASMPWWQPFNLTTLQMGLFTIAIYFLIVRGMVFLTAIPLGQVIHKIGASRAMVISYFVRALMYIGLYYSGQSALAFVIATVLDGIQINLFWNSYYTVLSQNTLRENLGKDLGVLQLILQIVAAISPALSGLVAGFVGFEVLFLFGLVLSLASGIIALEMNLKHIQDTVSWQEFKTWMKEEQFRRIAVSFSGRYIHDSVLFIWPLYIFFLVGTVERVGFLYAASLFMAILFTYFIGMYIDKAKTKKSFFVSGSFLSVIWLMRTQVFGIWSIALVDMFDKLTANFHWLFFETMFMRRGKGKQALSFFVYREMIRSITAVIFWLLFILFFWFFESWNAIFIFAGIGVLLTLLAGEKHSIHHGRS